MKTHKELIEDRKKLQQSKRELEKTLDENKKEILLLCKDIIVSFLNSMGLEFKVEFYDNHNDPYASIYVLGLKNIIINITSNDILFQYNKYYDVDTIQFYGKDYASVYWHCTKTPFYTFYNRKLKKLFEIK